MKELIIKGFLIATFFITSSALAQGLNKTSLLNELNKTYGIQLDTLQKSNFESGNKELVFDLLSMEDKKLPKEERDKEIDKLFDKRDKNLTAYLGVDKYSDIKLKTEEKIKQIIQKVKKTKITP